MQEIDQRTISIDTDQVVKTIVLQTLDQGGSFALWRKPQSNEKILFVCNQGVTEQDEVNLEESEPGFVFAPFKPDAKKIFLRADLVFKFKGDEIIEGAELFHAFSKSNLTDGQKEKKLRFHSTKSKSGNGKSYEKLVEQGVLEIENGSFEKIVPSRFKDIAVDESFDLLIAFELLCEKHPNAMASLFSSPQTGTWLGASPELLVSVDAQSKFKTHALAGTLPYSPEINLKSVAWTQKEIEEQALVSRYIINCFKKIRVREYLEHGPKTIVAGNVMHLKTDYEIDMKEINFPQLGSVMLKLLHPTSAVCGMPLDAALKFLNDNEGYDREFYSGFLGPVNYQNESNLFVNLRCLQFLENKVRLYAGAGVTLDSDPEKEWDETEIKMKNMMAVIGDASNS